MRRPARVIFLFLLLAAPALRAQDVEEDFQAFHRRFSAAAYHYPRHGAAPLGLVGFEVYADATVDQDFGDEPYVETILGDDLIGDFLAVGRVGVRKGLPGGLDLGVAYARALDTDIKLFSADLQYAILKGGVLSPALSVRVTGTRTLDAGDYELDQYGAELIFSKGFTVVTPYVGGGFVYSEGRFDSAGFGAFEDEETRNILYGGVVINLLLPKIVVEVEKGEVVTGAVKVGFGF
jgi:hypothetical protein